MNNNSKSVPSFSSSSSSSISSKTKPVTISENNITASSIYGVTHLGKTLFSKHVGKKQSSSRRIGTSAAASSQSEEQEEFLRKIQKENEFLDGLEQEMIGPSKVTAIKSSDDIKKENARFVETTIALEKETSSTVKQSTEYKKKGDIFVDPGPAHKESRESSVCNGTSSDTLEWHKFGFDFGSYPSVFDEPYFLSFVNHVESLGITSFKSSQKNMITRLLQGESFQVTSACGSGKSFALIGTFVGCMAKESSLVWVYDRKGNHNTLVRNQMVELISCMSGNGLTRENGSIVDFGNVDDMREFEQSNRAPPKIFLTPCAKLMEVLSSIEGHVVVAFDECQSIFNEAEEFEMANEDCVMNKVLTAFQEFSRSRRSSSSRPSFQVVCISAVGDLVEKKIIKNKAPEGRGFRSVSIVVSEFFDRLGIVAKVDGQVMPVVNANDDHRRWLKTFVLHLLDHEAIYEQSLYIAMKLLSPGRNIFVVRDGGQLIYFLNYIRSRGLTVTSNWDKWCDPGYRIILVRDTEVGLLQGQNIHDLTGVYIFTLPPERDLHLSFQAIGRVGRLNQIGTQTRALVFMDKSMSRQQNKELAAQAILGRYLKEEYEATVVKLQTHMDHKELDLSEFGFDITDFPIVPVDNSEPDPGNRLYLCPNPFSVRLLREGERPRCRCKREHPFESSLIKWLGQPPRVYLDESRYLATAAEPAYNVYNTMPSLCIPCAFGQCCDRLSSRLIHFGSPKFHEVSEVYLRKFVETNVCSYGFFAHDLCMNEKCSQVHRGDERLTVRVQELCMKYFVNKGVCPHAYYWKACDCDCSIQPHIGYDDPRLDVPFGDNADNLRKNLLEYVARKHICMYGCYDGSRCKETDCKRAHCGDRALLDEDTVRVFRRVYLEKQRSNMKKCRDGSAHNILLCPYFHFPEDAKRDNLTTCETAPLGKSMYASTTIADTTATTTITTTTSAENEIVLEIEGILATSEQVLSFDSAKKGELKDTLPGKLTTPSPLLPSSDIQPVMSPSAVSSWSKPTTACSKSLSDIMREEEELEAARCVTKSATTCNTNQRQFLTDIFQTRVKGRFQHRTPYNVTPDMNPTRRCNRSLVATTALTRSTCNSTSLTAEIAEIAETPHTSISPSCKPCLEECFPIEGVDGANSIEGGWTSVKKKIKQYSGPSTRPRDLRDIKLECIVCRRAFVYSVEDQKFYASKNWSQPKTCQQCREKRRGEKNREEWKDRKEAGHGYR